MSWVYRDGLMGDHNLAAALKSASYVTILPFDIPAKPTKWPWTASSFSYDGKWQLRVRLCSRPSGPTGGCVIEVSLGNGLAIEKRLRQWDLASIRHHARHLVNACRILERQHDLLVRVQQAVDTFIRTREGEPVGKGSPSRKRIAAIMRIARQFRTPGVIGNAPALYSDMSAEACNRILAYIEDGSL